MKARFAVIISAAITIFFSSCGDGNKEEPTPIQTTTGSVQGTIFPANSASQVFLITGTDTIKGNPTAAGTYELTKVNAGTYQLTVKANDGYLAPAPTTVSVTAGQKTTAPVTTVSKLPANGLVSVNIDGTVYSGEPTYFPSKSGHPVELTMQAGQQEIRMTLPLATGLGTYSTTSDGNLAISVFSPTGIWVSNYNMGNATFTITSFNPITKRGNATFSFTAENSGSADKVGTYGILKNIILRN